MSEKHDTVIKNVEEWSSKWNNIRELLKRKLENEFISYGIIVDKKTFDLTLNYTLQDVFNFIKENPEIDLDEISY